MRADVPFPADDPRRGLVAVLAGSFDPDLVKRADRLSRCDAGRVPAGLPSWCRRPCKILRFCRPCHLASRIPIIDALEPILAQRQPHEDLLLATFTHQRWPDEPLRDARSRLSRRLTNFWRLPPFRQGCRARLTRIEYAYSPEDGWHVHAHLLMTWRGSSPRVIQQCWSPHLPPKESGAHWRRVARGEERDALEYVLKHTYPLPEAAVEFALALHNSRDLAICGEWSGKATARRTPRS